MLDEVLRSVAVVARTDQVPHHRQVGVDDRQLAGERLIACPFEEVEQRRLVQSGSGHQIRACRQQCQGDVRSIGVAGDVHALTTDVFDQPREVGGILSPAAWTVAGLATGVATPIPRHHPVPRRRARPAPVPSRHRLSTTRASGRGIAGAPDLVVELDAVDDAGRHLRLLPRSSDETTIPETSTRHNWVFTHLAAPGDQR